MQTTQTNKKSWLWLAVILLLFIVFSFVFASGQPKEYPSYVSESPAPTGTKAFYTYLKKHYPTERWEHTPDLLPKEDNHDILLMIEPIFIPDSMEMQKYINYMEAGNTIFLLKNNPDGMFDISTEPVIESEEIITVEDQAGKEYEAEVLTQTHSRIEAEASDDMLLKDDLGVMALQRPFGEGSLIVANAPDWLTNESITEKGHLDLLFSLMQIDGDNSRVLFDEYVHGSGNAPSFTALYPKWMLVFGLQLMILTILWLWYKGKRFGPVQTPREATVRFSNEQITAIAAWFQRGRRYHDSLTLQADYLKVLLQERWSVPYRKSWRDSSEQMAQKMEGISEDEVYKLIERLTNLLNKKSVTKQEYVAWSKRLDQLQREVEEK